MDNRFKILLNKEKSVNSVNRNSNVPINLEDKSRLLPLSNEQTVVNAYEQFEKERRESTIYRFYGVINTIASNCLYNENVNIQTVNNGSGSLGQAIGLGNLPGNINPNDVFGFVVPSHSIFVNDGWYGYYDNIDTSEAQIQNDNESSLCQFKTFDPGYDRLLMLDDDGKQNYLLKITYPFATTDINLVQNNEGISLKNGIQVIEKGVVTINNRNYTYFKTPINHGLSEDDDVKLINFTDNQNGGLYLNNRSFKVVKLGNQNNNLTNRIFVVDINPNDIDIDLGISTIRRVVSGVESQYYVRRLKSITTEEKDYDIYPAAYGVNYFDDKEAGFYFKTDVDVNGLRDNLGRPLSELFLTIVKNDNDTPPTDPKNYYWMNEQKNLPNNIKNRFWMPIVGGYETEKNTSVNYNIRAVGANYAGGNPNYPQQYFENIDESNDVFDNDIVEYNEYELFERSLEDVYHRINTVYRDNLNTIDSNKLDKREGYIYNPHKKIQIREFSQYVEEGDLKNTLNIPDYAHLKYSDNDVTNIGSGSVGGGIGINNLLVNLPTGPLTTLPLSSESVIYRWRDLLEIGFVDSSGNGVEYPFESGAHYLYLNQRFYLFRQDPPCEVNFTSESVTLPQDVDLFKTYISEPTFYDYQVDNVISILGSDIPTDLLDPNILPTDVDIRFITYTGEYNLGERDTPGGCVDYSSLQEKTITDVC